MQRDSPRALRRPWVWGGPSVADGFATRDLVDPPGTRRAVRAVETDADPDVLFLWLCQLRRAPYSYDWIDNRGRRSPRVPDPALLDLRPGVTVARIFTLDAYEPGRSVTFTANPGWPVRVFGAVTIRYDIDRLSAARSRLRATLWMPPPPGPLGRARRYVLAWGDLVMMRRQLRVLCGLAEGTPHPS